MASRRIEKDVELRLMVASGGRCEFPGCNKYLLHDGMTFAACIKGQKAHIWGFSQKGPRPNKLLTDSERNDFSNLLLLCHECHLRIDTNESTFSVQELKKHKMEHEDRIFRVTDIDPSKRTQIIMYKGKIVDRVGSIDYNMASCAVVANGRYPEDSLGITIDQTNISPDANRTYYKFFHDTLKQKVDTYILSGGKDGLAHRHFSIFAISDIPLLIALGKMLGDITTADVYERFRDTADWIWKKHQPREEYKIYKEGTSRKIVALNLSLSGTIMNDLLRTCLDDRNAKIYTITIKKPRVNSIRSQKQLALFKATIRDVITNIQNENPRIEAIHVFPAMPVSSSVELGRCLLQKGDVDMKIYDYDKAKGNFEYCLTL